MFNRSINFISKKRLNLTAKVRNTRILVVLLLIMSITITITNKIKPDIFIYTRVAITDKISPIINVISSPIYALNNGVSEIKALFNTYENNKILMLENNRLKQKLNLNQGLLFENKKLRNLLNMLKLSEFKAIGAKIIADTSGSFAHSFIVNLGKNNGLEPYLAVVTDVGLVGRVVEVGKTTARILSLNDINSRIPVIIGKKQQRAVLSGNNSQNPEIIFTPIKHNIKLGDIIKTSGHEGSLPANLPIGTVSKVENDKIFVKLFNDSNAVTYVTIIKQSSL